LNVNNENCLEAFICHNEFVELEKIEWFLDKALTLDSRKNYICDEAIGRLGSISKESLKKYSYEDLNLFYKRLCKQ